MMAKPRLLLLDEPSLGLAPLVVREIFDVLRRMNEAGTTIVVVEQNATLALALGAARVRARDRAASCSAASRGRCRRTSRCAGATSATDGELPPAGRQRARVGRDLRLARARDRAHPPRDRRAQLRAGRAGDALGVHLLDAVDHGWSFWPAFGATIALSFGGGVAARADGDPADPERPAARDRDPDDRPADRRQRPRHLDLGRRRAAVQRAVLDRADPRRRRRVLEAGHRRDRASRSSPSLLLAAPLRAARSSASACAPRPSTRPRRVWPACACRRCSRVGWGLAAALGAVAGVMAAPSLFLEPNMMQTVLLYAFAAAVLGGMDSPIGAVIGGLDPRRAAEPRRHLRALGRRRAAARGRARRHPRRAARAPGRAVRPTGGEARMRPKLIAFGVGGRSC